MDSVIIWIFWKCLCAQCEFMKIVKIYDYWYVRISLGDLMWSIHMRGPC